MAVILFENLFMISKGFTLIEIIVVILIVGILATLSIRIYIDTTLTNFKLQAAKQTLVSDLKKIKSLAIQKQLPQKIIFPDYTIYEKHTTQNLWILTETNFSQIPDNIAIINTTLADNQIIFDTDGTPYEDPQSDLPLQSLEDQITITRSITLQSSSNLEEIIYIIPDTGYVF